MPGWVCAPRLVGELPLLYPMPGQLCDTLRSAHAALNARQHGHRPTAIWGNMAKSENDVYDKSPSGDLVIIFILVPIFLEQIQRPTAILQRLLPVGRSRELLWWACIFKAWASELPKPRRVRL